MERQHIAISEREISETMKTLTRRLKAETKHSISDEHQRTYNCPFCNDRGYVEYIEYPDGRSVQLSPDQPSGLAVHEHIKRHAISCGADPSDVWAYLRAHHSPIRVSVASCSCSADRIAFNRLKRILDEGMIPPRYHGYTWDTWLALPPSKRKGADKMYKAARQFAEFKEKPEADTKYCLVLAGPPGVGKTGLGTCVLMDWARAGYGVYWLDCNRFLFTIRSTYNDNPEVNTDQVINAAARAPRLLFDDMGDMSRFDPVTDHTRDRLYEVFSERFNRMLPTLVTTNLDQEAFERQFGPRLTRRVIESSVWIHAV